ncbi:hypothetical protein [Anaerohalosphaera lusitana]|nr:hypothetical protein [Anaerohalosphaera lusitana]
MLCHAVGKDGSFEFFEVLFERFLAVVLVAVEQAGLDQLRIFFHLGS